MDSPTSRPSDLSVRPAARGPHRLLWRTVTKAWGDSIFGRAAQAAFWQTLSLPPLLLGLLGSIGYIGGWFGPDTVEVVQSKILTFCRSTFSPSVVDQIIAPTVSDVLLRGRADIVSLGFLLSLWAGSSAVSSFVDSIVLAHNQHNERNPVWQRIFALLLYVVALVLAVFTVPLLALGPGLVSERVPETWRQTTETLIQSVYYPTVGVIALIALATLYKFALPRSLPWHRMIPGAIFAGAFFLAAAAGLRMYFSWVTSTGYTYGALASPIAFLLFTFFLGFAVVLGAEFNATVQEFWPAKATRLDQMRERIQLRGRSDDGDGPEEDGPEEAGTAEDSTAGPGTHVSVPTDGASPVPEPSDTARVRAAGGGPAATASSRVRVAGRGGAPTAARDATTSTLGRLGTRITTPRTLSFTPSGVPRAQSSPPGRRPS
ncbi:YhjD/YihY/BrkB family envelope integrity protein [Rhodococcus sp. X156]|uniref:YihY/virulence factor BrkB family protein n=1 Tax=Rhodococcus sp. X156 TaxID=2499145 RepID=UPI000FDB3C87|nr:YhjD/YihY/BrkB family envelope integrity protein [Rhodococcus sp. X156]